MVDQNFKSNIVFVQATFNMNFYNSFDMKIRNICLFSSKDLSIDYIVKIKNLSSINHVIMPYYQKPILNFSRSFIKKYFTVGIDLFLRM